MSSALCGLSLLNVRTIFCPLISMKLLGVFFEVSLPASMVEYNTVYVGDLLNYFDLFAIPPFLRYPEVSLLCGDFVLGYYVCTTFIW